jgi:hypothetical protein
LIKNCYRYLQDLNFHRALVEISVAFLKSSGHDDKIRQNEVLSLSGDAGDRPQSIQVKLKLAIAEKNIPEKKLRLNK